MALGFNGGIRMDAPIPGALKIMTAKFGKDYIYTVPKDFLVCVSVGDTVSHDDYIAVHSDGSVLATAVSGMVKEITRGQVHIESDLSMPKEHYPIAQDIQSLEKNEIVDHIRLAGLFSESGIPLWRMLAAFVGKCETLIINGAETNPGVTCRRAVLRAYPEKVIGGIKIVMRALSLGKAVLVMTEHMQTEAGAIRSQLEQKKLIDIYGIAAKYPAENDKVVFAALTGCYSEPSARKALILSVHDCIAVFDLFVHGRHQAIRTVTVQNQNINIPVGTPVDTIDTLYSLNIPKKGVTYIGGGIGSYRCGEYDAVCEGTTAVFYKEKMAVPAQADCIGCGRCHIHCPIGLMPIRLLEAIKENNQRKLTWYQIGACIQCGTCSAVCPSYLMPHEKIGAYQKGELPVEQTANQTSLPLTADDTMLENGSIGEIDVTEEIGILEQEDTVSIESDGTDVKFIGSIDKNSEEGQNEKNT